MNADGPTVCFTVDAEQDCPPYRSTFRGMAEGLPRLLDLLAELRVPATIFATGEVARRFPTTIERLVLAGHELGCHGDTHRDFTTLTPVAAEQELRAALATLRPFATVTSFRAPYLRFPAAYLPLLAAAGIHVDSSQARYKFGAEHRPGAAPTGLRRVPASVTSSVLRLPAWVRDPWLRTLTEPVVPFVHPWEFVDLRRENLRFDCRFRTGDAALTAVREALTGWRDCRARFVRLRDLNGA
jgi:peptidoglycan/xylan/chitin deacetylase (PgdA/CDA1 family)